MLHTGRPRGRLGLARALAATVVGLAVLVPPTGQAAAEDTVPPPEPSEVVDLTFPTTPPPVTRYTDTFDAARSGGRRHEATDIMGEKLLPIYAAVGGVVEQHLSADDAYGYRLRIKGTDGRTYSYVHLNNDTPGTDDGAGGPEHAYAPGIAKGVTVARGQLVAFMGDSGNAEETAPHLHFSITDVDGTVINPYASLKAAEARGDFGVDTGVRPPTEPTTPSDPPAPGPGGSGPPTLRSPVSLVPACPPALVPSAVFADVPATSPHLAAVDCLAWRKVTLGLDSGLYGPEAEVSRLQMASFTARLLESAGVSLPADPPDAFDDDAGSVHEKAINQLVAIGIITGDTGERGLERRDFEGEVEMKRDRMAAWMVRAHELITGAPLPAPSWHPFRDMAQARDHVTEIEQLAALGVVQGTGGGRYEPNQGVRRDQMASYLARTLAVSTR